LAHSQRGWTGARTPSAIKRVRQTQRRRAINQPRRTAAKTLIGKAVTTAADVATNGTSPDAVREAVERAVSALDRAAKIGAIHRNAADRRKSRLMLKINAALGGDGLVGATKSARQTSKAAAAKQAKARIAASRATKAKGAQTAAGKARAALARTSRDSQADTPAAATPAAESTTAKRAPSRPAPSASSTKASATKSTASKSSAAKAGATKSSATKATATKAATKATATKAKKTS
jgi:trimeric autotransporter adhesin